MRLIADGVIDADRLSLAVTTKIKRKEEARKSLTNCFTKEHIFLINELMSQYDHLTEKIKRVDSELFDLALPYKHLVEKLDQIPGIDEVLAIGILAESTADMSNFKDERAYAAWAGVAAGNNESAGKKKDQSAAKGIPTSDES